MAHLDIDLAQSEIPIHLPSETPELSAVHIFDADSVYAVNTALAAKRPLLVRGDPGVGKSQLARAAAKVLGRVFLPYTVDIQTEARDLLWRFDAMRRLAEAQVAGALAAGAGKLTSQSEEHVRPGRRESIWDDMAMSRFLHPGPLWWAFDWGSASEQAEKARAPVPPLDGADPANGCVLLIDEIDKAETDVPNGLLEALGAGQFTPVGQLKAVRASRPLPLVVITTNEERALPDAFLRRCVVLNLEFPPESVLLKRGEKHFPDVCEEVRKLAAEQLLKERGAAIDNGVRPRPGQAEYMDLLRALHELRRDDPEGQKELLNQIKKFVLRKHRDGV